jgi:acyl-CoA synthetase (AMP-forming)/AMP-acid ligase II
MSEPGTLLSCLERAAAAGEQVRFLERSEVRAVLYRDLLERARSVAGGLAAIGIEPGSRVGVAVPTGPEFYDAFFGVLAAGAVPLSLPLPPRFGSRRGFNAEIQASLRAAGARLVLTDAAARLSLSGPAEPPVVPLTDLPAGRARQVDRDPGAVALVQLSSGTTGSPKPIPLTHSQLLANVGAIRDRVLECYPAERGYEHGGVSWLPLYHDMGLVGAVLTALAHPAPLALMRPEEFVARPARWLQAISRYRATISAAPHFAYQLALERVRDDELEGVDLSSWLLALAGAETVTASTLSRFYHRFRAYGLRRQALTPVYGLAEASLAVTFSDPGAPFSFRSFDGLALVENGRAVPSSRGVEIVSSGKPLPGVDLKIADESGAGLDEKLMGRVLVRGPSVTSDGVDADGFFDTGDRGFLCAGELYLFGRSRDLLVLRGRNYAPEMIEEAVEGVFGLRPGAVAAVSLLGERGEGLCVLAERGFDLVPGEAQRAIEEIRARVVERCGVDPVVVFLEPGALPRTSSGKIRRQEAGRLFARALV